MLKKAISTVWSYHEQFSWFVTVNEFGCCSIKWSELKQPTEVIKRTKKCYMWLDVVSDLQQRTIC